MPFLTLPRVTLPRVRKPVVIPTIVITPPPEDAWNDDYSYEEESEYYDCEDSDDGLISLDEARSMPHIRYHSIVGLGARPEGYGFSLIPLSIAAGRDDIRRREESFETVERKRKVDVILNLLGVDGIL